MRFLFQHLFIFLARLLLSLFFLWNGLTIINNWQSHSETLINQQVQFAVPLLAFEVFCLLLGGLMLVVGFRGRVGALLLIIFLVPDTLVHTDWSWLSTVSLPALEAHSEQVTHLAKNLGLLGGLLLVLGFGSGGFSFDFLTSARKKKREKK